MKKINFIMLLSLLFMGLTSFNTLAQISSERLAMPSLNNPWTDNQLLEPSLLAGKIKAGGKVKPLIFNIGAVEDIKGAKHIGAVSNAENLAKLSDAENVAKLRNAVGDSDECDHSIPAQADHPFRAKLTRAFRGKLTTPNA
ncbi:hypothetical protein BH09BAC6_BH09BAC6_33340 [soil metagenome]